METGVLDLVPEAVVVLSAEGLVRGANRRAAALLDVGAEDRGRPVTEVLALRDRSGRACGLPPPRPALSDRSAEHTLWVERPARGPRPLAVVWHWRDDAVVLSARPAGAREARERVQGDVVATVSHELRSPLASVKGFTRTLLARWDRLADPDKRAMLETVDVDADRLARLIQDLLEVSRIDAGRLRLERAPVDVGALARDVVDRAARTAADHDRGLDLHVAPGLPRVPADRGRLLQVLDNLVDNALQHGAGEVGVHVAPAAGGVEVLVTDAGAGIPPELERRVFRKFGRGRDERRPGTGLGLYLARALVDAHGGRLDLLGSDERPDVPASGARLRCWLPGAGT